MEPIRVRGRYIDDQELEFIRGVVDHGWERGRTWISRELCQRWDWRQPNGYLKDQVCRILLNTLHRRGLIDLPPRKSGIARGKRSYYVPPDPAPEYRRCELTGMLHQMPPVRSKQVRRQPEEALWNYLMHRFHYQGYRIIVGEHLKYMAFMEDIPVACLAWSSPVFRIADRDRFIGWPAEARSRNIRLIANNSRFLILPWIRVKNLASHLLARSIKVIGRDWMEFYGHPVYLLETFVETARFRGTCYRAGNWIRVGATKGFAKKDGKFYHHGNRKDIYVYPLHRDFRQLLDKGGA